MTSTGRIHRVALSVFALLVFCPAQGNERRVDLSWDFTTATTPLGWYPYEPSSGFGLSNGALIFQATEQTWVLKSPSISVHAAPLQVIEIEMSSETTGRTWFGWCYDDGAWGGSELDMMGDGSFHDYYLPMDSSSATTIYQLAVVPPAGSTIAIRYVALVTPVPSAAPPVPPLWQFDADGDTNAWVPYSDVLDMTVTGDRLRLHALTYATAPI
jgi:hypothetical protein